MFTTDSIIPVLPAAGALNKSVAHFARPTGPDLLARTEAFARWRDARQANEVWPYSRAILASPDAHCTIRNESGRCSEGINFANTDYLGLSTHPLIREAAVRAIYEYGPHSPSSPMLQGNTGLSLALEAALSEWLQMEHVALFTTGWGAGFGCITALVRPADHVILDNLAHARLQQGAQFATQNIYRHAHLDIEGVVKHLQAIRQMDSKNGILVVSEGLFSMDSDFPDLMRLQRICREYEATLMVDVAHDLGCMGPDGTGTIGAQQMLGQIDLVMGAFSKSFGTNGGFVATRSHAVRHYIKTYGGSHLFSTAMSPVQAAVALEAIRIIRSPEGERLRARMMHNVHALRNAFIPYGITCMGEPTPIVPVPIGNEKLARVSSALLFAANVFANLVEFPAVAVGSARFRMQVMSTHSEEDVRIGARSVCEAISQAHDMLNVPEEAVVQVRH